MRTIVTTLVCLILLLLLDTSGDINYDRVNTYVLVFIAGILVEMLLDRKCKS